MLPLFFFFLAGRRLGNDAATPAASPSSSWSASGEERDAMDSATTRDYVQEQIDWVVGSGSAGSGGGSGGYVDPRLEFRRASEVRGGGDDASTSNISSPIGVFTSEPVRKGQLLMKIPFEKLLSHQSNAASSRSGGGKDSADEDLDDDDFDEDPFEDGDTCRTVVNIAKHRRLGDKSRFAPYLSYLYEAANTEKHKIPSQFSKEAKLLIKKIVGLELPTYATVTSMTFRRFCRHLGVLDFLVLDADEDDTEGEADTDDDGILTSEELEEAFSIWLRRSWDLYMVPLLDMINHSNRHNTNLSNLPKGGTSQDEWGDEDSDSEDEDNGSRKKNEIDDDDDDNEGDYVRVFATEDIDANQELLVSYNNCTGSYYPLSYVTQHVFRDFGFVDEYPQRYLVEPVLRNSVYVFEIDRVNNQEDDSEPEYMVTWLQGRNTSKVVLRFLRGHLIRLQNMQDEIEMTLQKSGTDGENKISDHERTTILRYYESLKTAFEYAIYSIHDALDEAAIAARAAKAAEQDYDDYSEFDPLDTGEHLQGFQQVSHYLCDIDREHSRYGEYVEIDDVKSHYQSFKYDRLYIEDEDGNKKKIKDTCLYIDGRLHVCSTLRPHYHELLIHYPARYLAKTPKRVLYMGGGDNMVLHEVLRFPDLELVVGLELDQSIVRNSFRYFRTCPHWDDERVEWWYGDAAKSFQMLPQHYYGSFDLVIVDLESAVIDMVKVNDNLNIMDAALLLLAPHGIISRNVDFSLDASHRFTKYAFDTHTVDIPMFCYLGAKIGSHSEDLLQVKPRDHPLVTDHLYLPGVDDPSVNSHHELWYNYITNEPSNTVRLDHCCQDVLSTLSKDGNAGVIMILEAEHVTADLTDTTKARQKVSRALSQAGLTELSDLSVRYFSTSEEDETTDLDDGEVNNSVTFILREGYVIARIWPEFQYVAFDIHLWNKFDDLDEVKHALVTAVGSQVEGKSSSSYRIVASGMRFPDYIKATGKSATSCPCGPSNTAAETKDGGTDATELAPVSDTLLTEGLRLMRDPSASVVVLCGQESRLCSTALALESAGGDRKVLTLWACPGLVHEVDGAENDVPSMKKCVAETQALMRNFVNENGKLGGIVIALEAPRLMGQVLLKVLDLAKSRRELLTENFLVLEASSSMNAAETGWRRTLLDRFRTALVVYDPAHKARVLLKGGADGGSSTNLELGIFSAGDPLFFTHLAEVRTILETKTGLASEVSNVKNGQNNFVAGTYLPFPLLYCDAVTFGSDAESILIARFLFATGVVY